MILSTKQLFIFILSLVLLIFFCYFYVDKSVSLYFIEHADTYKLIGKKVSTLGESQWYIATAILGALFYKFVKPNEIYKQRFLFLLYINLFSGLISLISKMFFGRLRPWKLENGGDGYGFLIAQNEHFTFLENINYQITMIMKDSTHYTSFPSGHTTTSMALFTYMVILFPKQTYIWVTITFVAVASRILANDHFISDILAGTIVGVLSTLFIYSKIKEKIEKNY